MIVLMAIVSMCFRFSEIQFVHIRCSGRRFCRNKLCNGDHGDRSWENEERQIDTEAGQGHLRLRPFHSCTSYRHSLHFPFQWYAIASNLTPLLVGLGSVRFCIEPNRHRVGRDNLSLLHSYFILYIYLFRK